jgi:hypothetical protein
MKLPTPKGEIFKVWNEEQNIAVINERWAGFDWETIYKFALEVNDGPNDEKKATIVAVCYALVAAYNEGAASVTPTMDAD